MTSALSTERDGTEVVPSSLEAPYQRGLTERAGGVFKDILYKAMKDYDCQSEPEWRELVDITCMTRNRLLIRGGWMSGIAAVRKDFESMPKRGFVDLTKDSDPPEFSESQMSLRDSTSLSQLLQLSQSPWRRMHLLRTPFLPRSRLLMGWTLRAL